MASNKKITDLTDYTSVLPYATEMFGVYQPMIGWKSQRITKRLKQGLIDTQAALLQAFAKNYQGIADVQFDTTDCAAAVKHIGVGKWISTRLLTTNSSVLIQSILN